MSRVVGNLAESGLIRRQIDSHYARVASVPLTDSGLACHERIEAQRAEIVLAAVTRLGSGRQRALIAARPALEHLSEIVH